jgi:hypothetical protein
MMRSPASSPWDISTAKRRKAVLPWETGLAAQVLADPIQGPLFSNLQEGVVKDRSWDLQFLGSASECTASGPAGSSEIPGTKFGTAPWRMKKLPEGKPAWTAVARKTQQVSWKLKVDEDRAVAIERWRIIVTENPAASAVGRQLTNFFEGEGEEEKSQRVLSDVFEPKATSTLQKRAGALLQMMRWLRAKHAHRTLLPFDEAVAYSYLCSLRENKAPASRSQSFREAVAFAFGLIGADGAETIMTSSRCQGVALALLKTKAIQKQKSPWKVFQVEAFEEGVFCLDDIADRIFSGFNAACIHLRSRFSDTSVCESEPVLDYNSSGFGFLEVQVLETKTSNKKSRRRRRLGMAAHSHGVTNRPWAEEYLRLRKVAGLNAAGGPLMPAISADGSWTQARLRSQEASLWTLEILRKMNVELPAAGDNGTHKSKTTLLSWCAKAFMPVEDRRLLGYHAATADDTSMVYSRDAAAGPLYKLGEILTHVRTRRFRPDETRSGRWVMFEDWHGNSDGKTVDEVVTEDAHGQDDSVPKSCDHNKNAELQHYHGSASDKVSDEHASLPSEDSDPFGEADPLIGSSNIDRFVFCRTCHSPLTRELWEKGPPSRGDLVCDDCWYSLPPAKQQDDGEETEDDMTESSVSSSSSEPDSEEGEERAAAVAAEIVATSVERKPSAPLDSPLWQHQHLKTLHLERKVDRHDVVARSSNYTLDEEDVAWLGCGRKAQFPFVRLSHEPAFMYSRCKTCFGTVASSSHE